MTNIELRLLEWTRLHSVADLIELIPGSNRANWRRWCPELIARGVLVKRNRKFLGKPAAIIEALNARN